MKLSNQFGEFLIAIAIAVGVCVTIAFGAKECARAQDKLDNKQYETWCKFTDNPRKITLEEFKTLRSMGALK